MDNDFFQYPFLALRDLNNKFILNLQGLWLYMNWNSTKHLLPGITLINSYLAFSFFHFSMATFYQLGVTPRRHICLTEAVILSSASSLLPLPRIAITSRPQVKHLTNVHGFCLRHSLWRTSQETWAFFSGFKKSDLLVVIGWFRYMLFISVMIDWQLTFPECIVISCNPIGQLYLGGTVN